MELHIEKINVSDNKFLVTKLHQSNGNAVKEGDLIYSIESSKASKDVEAPCDGFVFFANGVKEFEEYPANFLIAQIVDTIENPFAQVVEAATSTAENVTEEKEAVNVIATKEALAYAAKYGVDLSNIDADYITKWDVLEYIKSQDLGNYGYNSSIKRVAIIGAGRGAMQIIDLISHIDNFEAVALFDKGEDVGKTIYGLPVLEEDNIQTIYNFYKEGLFDYIVNGIGGSTVLRKRYFDELTSLGVPYCNLIHPSVVIGQNVTMGTGNILLPMTHIGPNAYIGNDCFMTAKSSIEHHNIVGSHCTFGPGVMMSGSVEIGECTKFGAGIFVEPLVSIGKNCLIASGSILTNNVPDDTIVRHELNLDFVPKTRF